MTCWSFKHKTNILSRFWVVFIAENKSLSLNDCGFGYVKKNKTGLGMLGAAYL